MTPQGLPRKARRRLGVVGRGGNQSSDDQTLASSTEPICPEPVDPQALLEQIRRRREALGPIDLSEETIRELRDEGRR